MSTDFLGKADADTMMRSLTPEYIRSNSLLQHAKSVPLARLLVPSRSTAGLYSILNYKEKFMIFLS
jgi:hypothetical protein